jgi:hypothetical protein
VYRGLLVTRRIETRSLHVLVSSDHPLANEQVAEALARVLSRYAVDFTPGLEVNVPQDGNDVPYVASAPNTIGSVALSMSRHRRTSLRKRSLLLRMVD